MKRIVLFVLCVTPLLISSARAGETEVALTGYGPRRYAVTGEVRQQFLDKVVAPLAAELNHSKDTQSRIVVTITGCADTTGTEAGNENYGLLRAQQLQGELTKRFGTAVQISTPITNGDKCEQDNHTVNARMVLVGWRVEKAINQPQQKMERAALNPLAIIACVAVIMVMIAAIALAFWKARTLGKKLASSEEHLSQKLEHLSVPAPISLPSAKYIKVTHQGGMVSVLCKYKDGYLVAPAPFCINNNSDLPICRKADGGSEHEMKRAIREFLKHNVVDPAVWQQLVAENVIKEKRGEVVQ